MICNFFPTGTGETRKATEYLQHDGARVIKGNLELTRQIADNISRKRKYTSGVLSFSENDLPYKIKLEIIKSFELVVFPGLLPDNYNITWVEHHDKNTLELHFISPRCEMKSGNDYSHYLHRFNKNKIDLWKDLINVKFNLSSPYEYDRALIVKPAPRNKKYMKVITEINNIIIDRVENKQISRRLGVIKVIKKFADIKITKVTKSKILIQLNDNESIAIGLRGKAYEKNFVGIDDFIEKAKIEHEIHIDNVRNNFNDYVQKLDRLLIKQTAKNRRIYDIDVYQQRAKVDESFNMLLNVDATKINQNGVIESSTSEIAKRYQEINHTQTPDDEFFENLFREERDSEDTDNLFAENNDYEEASYSNIKK